MPVAQDKMFTQATIEKGTFNDDERSFVAWASKSVLDRDGEIIAADAWDVDNFRRNPVILWAHDYSGKPLAKALWVKTQKNGMKFKPQFAPTDEGRETYMLYREGYLNAFSVGFIPNDFEEDEDQMVSFVGWFGGKYEKPLLTYTDAELLEISCVPVPACPDALVERMRDGKIKAKGLKQAIQDTMSKTIIPFKHYTLDPEDAAWDGPAERRDADTDDLRRMSTATS
jgi:HK97 family phage prohead protease